MLVKEDQLKEYLSKLDNVDINTYGPDRWLDANKKKQLFYISGQVELHRIKISTMGPFFDAMSCSARIINYRPVTVPLPVVTAEIKQHTYYINSIIPMAYLCVIKFSDDGYQVMAHGVFVYNACFDNLLECASHCNEKNASRFECGFYDYYEKNIADYYLESLNIVKGLKIMKELIR